MLQGGGSQSDEMEELSFVFMMEAIVLFGEESVVVLVVESSRVGKRLSIHLLIREGLMIVNDKCLGTRCGDHGIKLMRRMSSKDSESGRANVIIRMWQADLEVGSCPRKNFWSRLDMCLQQKEEGASLSRLPLHKRPKTSG